MMNTQIQTSHTEIEYPSANAMEQAALLKARCAVARWRCSDQLLMRDTDAASSARSEWYAALEQRMHLWIANGGLARDAGGRAPVGSENSCVG
jgi:hypothetical protein